MRGEKDAHREQRPEQAEAGRARHAQHQQHRVVREVAVEREAVGDVGASHDLLVLVAEPGAERMPPQRLREVEVLDVAGAGRGLGRGCDGRSRGCAPVGVGGDDAAHGGHRLEHGRARDPPHDGIGEAQRHEQQPGARRCPLGAAGPREHPHRCPRAAEAHVGDAPVVEPEGGEIDGRKEEGAAHRRPVGPREPAQAEQRQREAEEQRIGVGGDAGWIDALRPRDEPIEVDAGARLGEGREQHGGGEQRRIAGPLQRRGQEPDEEGMKASCRTCQ